MVLQTIRWKFETNSEKPMNYTLGLKHLHVCH